MSTQFLARSLECAKNSTFKHVILCVFAIADRLVPIHPLSTSCHFRGMKWLHILPLSPYPPLGGWKKWKWTWHGVVLLDLSAIFSSAGESVKKYTLGETK